MFFFPYPERSSEAHIFLFLFISFCAFTCVKEIFSPFVLFGFEAGICLCVNGICDLTSSVYLSVTSGLRLVLYPFMLCLAVIVSNFHCLVNVQWCSDEW